METLPTSKYYELRGLALDLTWPDPKKLQASSEKQDEIQSHWERYKKQMADGIVDDIKKRSKIL